MQSNEAYTRFGRRADRTDWERYSSIIRAPINPRGRPVTIGCPRSNDLISARDARYVLVYGIRRSRGGLINSDENLSVTRGGYFSIKPLVTMLSILKHTAHYYYFCTINIFDILNIYFIENYYICFPMKLNKDWQ